MPECLPVSPVRQASPYALEAVPAVALGVSALAAPQDEQPSDAPERRALSDERGAAAECLRPDAAVQVQMAGEVHWLSALQALLLLWGKPTP